MSHILPKSVDYREIPNSLLSDIYLTTQNLNPGNSKATYASNDTVNFNFNICHGFNDAKTIYIFLTVAWCNMMHLYLPD